MKFKDLYSLNFEWIFETDLTAIIYNENEMECCMSCRQIMHKYGEYTVSCFGSNWVELIQINEGSNLAVKED